MGEVELRRLVIGFAILLMFVTSFARNAHGNQDPPGTPEGKIAASPEWWAWMVPAHRDPVAVIQSAVTMNSYGARVRCKRVDIDGIAQYWIDRIEHLLRACVRDRELIPVEQSLDVVFHEFMADDIATVERIYRLADLEMTEQARRALGDFMTRNPRGKYGRVLYDLRADFGIDADELRKRFDFYFERFPIRAE